MEKVEISARNNLNVPIRLTLVNVGTNSEDARILITIGEAGVKLGGFYSVCIDTDLLPKQEWEEIGTLSIDTRCKTSIRGLEKQPSV
ncbi:hypothetical protein ES703_69799 [subsurface metagenome]